jgi:hypothetical protein
MRAEAAAQRNSFPTLTGTGYGKTGCGDPSAIALGFLVPQALLRPTLSGTFYTLFPVPAAFRSRLVVRASIAAVRSPESHRRALPVLIN